MLVTIDTNALEHPVYRRVWKAARAGGVPAQFRTTSIAEREAEGTWVPSLADPRVLIESGVVGESRVGRAIVSDDTTARRLEAVLRLMSNGAFPKPGERGNLLDGQQRQFHDAHHLTTHAQAGGAIFITNDTKAFGKPGAKLRLDLEALCSTKIMTVAEFCASCEARRRERERLRFGDSGALTSPLRA